MDINDRRTTHSGPSAPSRFVAYFSGSRTRPRNLAPKYDSQRGFTLAEIMVSLVVFTIAAVGLVAMQRHGLKAERAAMELREGERIAQEVMAELQASSFDSLIKADFLGQANPDFPYSDHTLGTETIRDYRSAPSGDDEALAPGRRRDFYWVGRRIQRFPSDTAQPEGDPSKVMALLIDVEVLWIDHSDPALPPPASAVVENLEPDNIVPGSDRFRAWVKGVTVQTIRVNDGAGTGVEESP